MAYEKKASARAAPKSRRPKEETDEEILEYAISGLKDCVDEEESERSKMRDDLRFCTLDQWPDDIRRDREKDVGNGPRPCLTIDKINQFITQVVNDMRQGRPGIVVRAQDDAADVETAKVLRGLVRNIEDQSNADIAYSTAGESAAKIGLGYFRILPEYVSEDSFDQDLFIRPIPNTFSVYLGKHILPDGSDAERAYVVETMPVEKFKQMFPKAKCESKDFDGVDKEVMGFWKGKDTVTVVEEYCIKKSMETLHFLADGTTISDEDYEAWPEEAGVRPSIQRSRSSEKRQLKWRKLTAVEVLDKRDLPGKYIPIVEVVGREAWVEGRRVVWGLVRPAKDSLRMYNYWASTITERMALAPKTPFIVAKGQLEGMEDKWKRANRDNFAYLEYNPVATDSGNALPPPERVGPTPIEAALLQQMEVIEHDVQTSLGMFKAAVGESESQQSGRAILALQRESDTSTYHFGANLGVSIRHAGRILVDLIPHYYDTKRIARILGEDGEVKTVELDPQLETSRREIQTPNGVKSIYNPTLGKYDVSITVGPSYNTKRMEAAATFVEMAKGAADPASAAVLRYLVMRNSDTAGSDEASKLLKTLLPPPALQALDSGEPIPPKAQAQMQQMGQQMQVMAEAGAKLQEENQKLQSAQQAKMAQVKVDHEAKMQEMQLERALAQEKANLERQVAESEFALKKWVAEQEAGIAKQKAQFEQDAKAAEMIPEGQFSEFYANRVAKEQVSPMLEDMTKAVVQGLQAVVEAIQAGNAQILAEMQKPKSVQIGNVLKGPDGVVRGATVASRTIN